MIKFKKASSAFLKKSAQKTSSIGPGGCGATETNG
jgi:hypothetical protein